MPPAMKDTHMTKPKTTNAKDAGKPTSNNPARANLRSENKTEKLIALLKRDGGAALGDITGATGWLPHSGRAMLTGLRKKGVTLAKTKVEGSTRYAITAEPSA